MRDTNRIPEVLQALGAAWMANPDMRLTQLISSAASRGGWHTDKEKCACGKTDIVHFDPYHMEDRPLMVGLLQLAQGDLG